APVNPAYAQIPSITNGPSVRSAATTDPRALQRPGRRRRVASPRSGSPDLALDVNITDGLPHQVALYFLDWDFAGRSVRVDVQAAGTWEVLDSRTVSN